jgi:hypothetical protein
MYTLLMHVAFDEKGLEGVAFICATIRSSQELGAGSGAALSLTLPAADPVLFVQTKFYKENDPNTTKMRAAAYLYRQKLPRFLDVLGLGRLPQSAAMGPEREFEKREMKGTSLCFQTVAESGRK